MSDMTMPELIVSLNKRIIKDGKRIAELEAEQKRSRFVIVMLRLAAESVLRGGRRFPPRAEWRELHEAVGGASRYLDDTWDDDLPPLNDVTGEVVGGAERSAP